MWVKERGGLMNTMDKVFNVFVVFLAATLFLASKTVIDVVSTSDGQVIVSYYDKEIQRYNLDEDGFHTVNGDLGDVVIEIKDGSVRVAEEISPKHYCKTQGWVKHTNTPIVCLPNGIKIELQNNLATEEDIKIQ